VLNGAVLLGGVACWTRWQRPDWDRGAMLLLVIPLAIGGLNNGQCNALIAGLLLFAQVWFARGQFWAAAGAIATCTLLKEYPLALGLLLALIEPRRFTPRLFICIAAGLLLPFALRSPDYVVAQYQAWIARLLSDDRSITVIALAYRDLHLLLRVLGLPLTLTQYRVLEMLLAGACATYVWLQRDSWSRQHATWVCGALASCWMTLAGPATESPTYVLAAPLLAACVLSATERSRWILALSLTSYALFTFAAIIVWFPGRISGPVHQSGIQPLAALLLSIVAVSLCRRESTETELQPAM
jgi:Glycosyltransferase family 87